MHKYGRQTWRAETIRKTWYGILWLRIEQAGCCEHCNESQDSWLTDRILRSEKGLYSLELGEEFRGKNVYNLLSYSQYLDSKICEKCSVLELLSETQIDDVRESYSMSRVACTWWKLTVYRKPFVFLGKYRSILALATLRNYSSLL